MKFMLRYVVIFAVSFLASYWIGMRLVSRYNTNSCCKCTCTPETGKL